MRLRHPRFHALSILTIALALFTFACADDRSHDAESGGAGGVSGMSGGSGGAGESGEGGGGVGGILVMEEPGEFVSADPNPNEGLSGGAGNAGAGGAGGMSGSAPPADGDPRTVVEGDIYRVLDAGALLNLNSYRGVQVIDVSDPNEPAIIGRFPVVGTPVEMYVRGTTAFVLLNDWQGYYGTRQDIAVKQKHGGLLVKVDISDRSAPVEVDRMFIEGAIRTSRVVQNDTVAALYIASSKELVDSNGIYSTRTVVTSFDIADQLVKKSELDLGGYVTDIQATPSELLVAGTEYDSITGVNRNTVSVVDISDPNGAMVLGDTVFTKGPVEDQFNMDIYNGVLRVVTPSWETSTNVVETFDAHDLSNITPLHSCNFGDGMQLFATLFLGNKAFFVTYFRSDPFHAFEIADDGSCVEHNEFIVSGWNDFLRPVAGDTRLIGVGTDDADGTGTPAVSLYDISWLANPNPLLDRDDAGSIEASWSEAQIDHRAFSVLEDAVSVEAQDGTVETGLVLLPYQGYETDAQGYGHYTSGVALFTFSGSTVSARGQLAHDSPVRRTFTTDPTTIANLSDTSLSLYDHSDPTAPEQLGSIQLAADYRRILRFGDYVARVRRSYSEQYSLSFGGQYTAIDHVEMVPANAELNDTAPVATFEVPANARLLKAGDRLVSVVQEWSSSTSSGQETYKTTATVFDLSDPAAPREAGSAETNDLVPTYFGYGYAYGYGGFYGSPYQYVGCGMGFSWFDGSQADGVFALGDRVVFVDARGESALLGTQHTCSYSPVNECFDNCQDQLSGYVYCQSEDGGPETCEGSISRCDIVDGVQSCEPVAFEDIRDQVSESCSDYERRRYWSRYAFKALDIGDPDEPAFGELKTMPRTEEGVSVLPAGDSLYYTYKVPVSVEDDARNHVSYYYKHVTFGDIDAIGVTPRINIPGELIAVEGSRLYSKDLRWIGSAAGTDAYMHQLSVGDGRAAIEASHRFVNRDMTNVAVDGGRIYVAHVSTYDGISVYEEPITKLALLDADGLQLESEIEVDSWAQLEAVHAGRALFTVSGGLLMMNLEDASAPYAQAFFNSNGWPEQILFEGDEILISAGMFGIHRFDANDANLLSED